MLSTLLKNENAKDVNAARGNNILKQRILFKISDLNTGLPMCKCLSLPHIPTQMVGETQNGNKEMPFSKEVEDYQIAM